MVPAISGCLSNHLASAQLSQCAACLNLTALLKSSPPLAKGRLLAALAEHAMAPGSTPVQKQLQIFASCWAANARDKVVLTVRMRQFTEQEDQPNALKVLLQQYLVFCSFDFELTQHKLWCAHWGAKNQDAAFFWNTVDAPSPHSHRRVHESDCSPSFQCLEGPHLQFHTAVLPW